MEHLIQHFRKDEQPFIERVIEWHRDVLYRHNIRLTDFLDPREQFIISSIIGQSDELNLYSEGIFDEAERKRMIICPSYIEPNQDDFQIAIFSVNYPSKFLQLKHRDVLGSLLSLGMSRSKFGDITIEDDNIQFAISKEIAEYVETNLVSIGKAKVQLELMADFENLIQSNEKWVEKTLTVSSMRLDSILSLALRISREKSKLLIQAGKVKVNWTVRESVSFDIQDGDILSVSGFGRIKILKIEGRTKKEKIRLIIGYLEQK
ncbi:YlmH family RNA-binding protein [Ureibacillus acetophenoni]|uniref:RNA-binding protein YlmH n=1 Tax=Ureibacillus acetophenoni TaxID=614649 RepID=A0A285U0D3_9BACL|nr:YlmH/Sll1252 family protein [Ureibacillus acetophenoni]SOC35375.1 RNA-binding protein YlmH [Ureibacillus acetophenoni]